MQRDVISRHTLHWLRKRIELMKAKVSSRLSRTQPCYQGYLDENVLLEQTFKVVDYLFVDRPPVAAVVSDVANEMASRRYSKLLRQASGH